MPDGESGTRQLSRAAIYYPQGKRGVANGSQSGRNRPALPIVAAGRKSNSDAAARLRKVNPNSPIPDSSRTASPISSDQASSEAIIADRRSSSPPSDDGGHNAPTSSYDGKSAGTQAVDGSLEVDVVALNNAALRASSEGRYQAASEFLRRALTAAPNSYRLHRNLSIVYESMKQLDNALSFAAKAVALAPDEPSAVAQWCEVQLASGRADAAVKCYDKLNRIARFDAEWGVGYGFALMRTARFDRAVEILERASGLAPSSPAVTNALGIAYFQDKRYKDAAREFKEAVEMDPEKEETRFNLAIAFMKTRNREGAMSQYRLIREKSPHLAKKLYRILFADKLVFVGAAK